MQPPFTLAPAQPCLARRPRVTVVWLNAVFVGDTDVSASQRGRGVGSRTRCRSPTAHCPLQCSGVLKEPQCPLPPAMWQCTGGAPLPTGRFCPQERCASECTPFLPAVEAIVNGTFRLGAVASYRGTYCDCVRRGTNHHTPGAPITGLH